MANIENNITEFIIYKRNLPHWQSPGSYYFITFRTFKNYILNDFSKQIIYDSIIYQENRTCKIISFVIMPDHVHIILQPIEKSKNEYYSLSYIMKSIKGFSSREIKKYLMKELEINSKDAQTGMSVLLPKHIFQDESFDRIIRNEEEFIQKMNYILNNPVKKGIIENGFDYKWYFLNPKQ